MKILITTHTQFDRNAYSKHLERAIGLQQRGHEVFFLITSQKNRFKTSHKEIEGVNVIMAPDLLWGPLRQGVDPWNIANRVIIALKLDVDLVHTIDSRPVTILPAMVLKVFKRTPLFSEWTDLFSRGGTIVERGSSKFYQATFGRVEQFFEEGFKKYADANFTISSKLKELLVSFGYPAERVRILPLACNMINALQESKEELKRKLSLDTETIYLLFGGKIFPQDAEFLVEVLRRIQMRRSENIGLILTGRHPWVTEDMKDELGILVTGWVDEQVLFDYLGAADLHVNPMKITIANKYRFPCKINDYFVAGRPLITTPISDLEQIHAEYEFGKVTKSDSVEEFVQVLDDMLSERAKWPHYEKEAFRCAGELLALEKISRDIEEYYVTYGGA